MVPRTTTVALLFATFVIVLGSPVWAQTLTGIISGTAGANISITNADTGVKAWTGKTNESGLYRAPDLSVGNYKIDVEVCPWPILGHATKWSGGRLRW